jgi:hypothetical protein
MVLYLPQCAVCCGIDWCLACDVCVAKRVGLFFSPCESDTIACGCAVPIMGFFSPSHIHTNLESASRPGTDLGTQAVQGKDSRAVDETTWRLACTSRVRRCFVGDGLLTFHSTWYLTHLRDRWHGSVEGYTKNEKYSVRVQYNGRSTWLPGPAGDDCFLFSLCLIRMRPSIYVTRCPCG